jgi:hypothetical protein
VVGGVVLVVRSPDILECDCIFPEISKKKRVNKEFELHSTHTTKDQARKVLKTILPRSGIRTVGLTILLIRCKKAGNNKNVYTYVCTEHVNCPKQARIKSRTMAEHDVELSPDDHSNEVADHTNVVIFFYFPF